MSLFYWLTKYCWESIHCRHLRVININHLFLHLGIFGECWTENMQSWIVCCRHCHNHHHHHHLCFSHRAADNWNSVATREANRWILLFPIIWGTTVPYWLLPTIRTDNSQLQKSYFVKLLVLSGHRLVGVQESLQLESASHS